MEVIYSPAELADKDEAELIALLKASWGYPLHQDISLVGKLKKVHNRKNDGHFFLLTNIRSSLDFKAIRYPVRPKLFSEISNDVFVSMNLGEDIYSDLSDGQLCIVEVDLNIERERKKRGNPLALKAVTRPRILTELPLETPDIARIEDKFYLEQDLVDHFLTKNRSEIQRQKKEEFAKAESKYREEFEAAKGEYLASSEEMAQKVEALSDTRDQVESEVQRLSEQAQALATSVGAAEILIEQKDQEIKELAQDYQERKNEMESSLSKLQAFVESKASKLVKLELLDESTAAHLLGNSMLEPSATDGIPLEQAFDGNLVAALPYIQAHLYDKDIYYSRESLQDFIALLRTNDLIILAGDSGSGKTNLVTSFASAIGGRAVVIPVKPNWTSSEDLLGYYNPLEKKYLSTQFLDSLVEASNNPTVPYLICLDEMNLARVEYYFADFLSLLEDRSGTPEIHLYSDDESSHALAECRTFLSLLDDFGEEAGETAEDFVSLLKNEEINQAMQRACGFGEGTSLISYHSELRRVLSNFINTPSRLSLPDNVRIIGTINVDETTHYLSPKILDRAHVVRFPSPFSNGWQDISSEIDEFDDLDRPLRVAVTHLGLRKPYPKFDQESVNGRFIMDCATRYLIPMGLEFGLRTVRQAENYFDELRNFGLDDDRLLNSFVLRKILPKLMFDGNKTVGDLTKIELLSLFRNRLEERLSGIQNQEGVTYCVEELDRVIESAESNDQVVNFWTK